MPFPLLSAASACRLEPVLAAQSLRADEHHSAKSAVGEAVKITSVNFLRECECLAKRISWTTDTKCAGCRHLRVRFDAVSYLSFSEHILSAETTRQISRLLHSSGFALWVRKHLYNMHEPNKTDSFPLAKVNHLHTTNTLVYERTTYSAEAFAG